MILSVKNIFKKYKDKDIINNISLSISRGEIVGLLGLNGVGKTTIFNIIIGIVKPNSGSIFINETDITFLPIYKKSKYGISYLPQDSSIFKTLTVEENILLTLEFTNISKNEIKKKLEILLEEFNIIKIRKTLGSLLSGGECRKVEIARLLSLSPKFLLLDEPFLGIDPVSIKDIQNIIKELKHKNIGILVSDHNIVELLSIIDRIYLIFNKKILKFNSLKEFINNKVVNKLYLGKNFYF